MVKTIKLQINLTNKLFYSLITIFIILILGVSIWAYKSGKSPSVLGHSGEEIEVAINGETKTLNQVLSEITSTTLTQTIACDWEGWKGALTMTIRDGSKHTKAGSEYYTTIFQCTEGKVIQIKYLLCQDANKSPYNAGIDCTE